VLGSLVRQTIMPSKVYLVLNGCGDDNHKLEKWATVLPLEITVEKHNRGFCAPHSAVLPKISTSWVAVLNADARAEADWLEEMLKTANKSYDIGMVACSVLIASNPTTVESQGLVPSKGGMAYLRNWGIPYEEDREREVFAPSGAGALYRVDMLKEVGFYWDDFFAYYEDLDLGWRARRGGWRCMLAPRARIHHASGIQQLVRKVDKSALLARNRLLTIVRNWGIGAILKNLPLIVLMDFLAFGKAIREGRFVSAIKGRLGFLKMLPRAIRTRKRLGGFDRAENWLCDDLPFIKARGFL
jgi:GT2 family glycosyltransferase